MLLLNRGTGRLAPAWESGGARETLSQPVNSMSFDLTYGSGERQVNRASG
jgi:hypothetical protein